MRERRELRGFRGEWENDVLEVLDDIVEIGEQIVYLLQLIAPRVRVATALHISLVSGTKIIGEVPSVTVQDIETLIATVAATDSTNLPTALDPSITPKWASSNTNICDVQPSVDGLTAVLLPNHLGVATISVSIPGIEAHVAVTVTYSKATKVTIMETQPK